MKKTKMILLVVIAFTMIITSISTIAETPITVTLDGQQLQFEVPPKIINERTIVPMRTIVESMGATLEWNSINNLIIAKKGNFRIEMQINNKVMKMNDFDVTLDVAPQIIDGRTLVPVRAIAKSLNADVQWDNENKIVKISTK